MGQDALIRTADPAEFRAEIAECTLVPCAEKNACTFSDASMRNLPAQSLAGPRNQYVSVVKSLHKVSYNETSSPVQSQPKITLILPAYNEVARIAGTIEQAVTYFRSSGAPYEIIVAADGTDGTRERVREIGAADPAVKVIGRAQRCGKGLGIREAVAMATGRYVGFADADNKVPIEEVGKILPLLEQGADVVIGSRALRESAIERKQPLYRRVGGELFRHVMRAVVGLPRIMDTQCGFKFFPLHVAQDLFGRQKIDGYMFDVEILCLAYRLGFHIEEVPIRWRDDGDSRLQLLRGNLQNARDLLRIRWMHRRLAPAAQVVHSVKA
jgi:dolichyl-phosphate beta-glucosyltransferase